MTEVPIPFQGRRLDARFTLLEKLGSGGQGEVWRAHDDTRGIDIALKVPVNAAQGAGAVAAFEREHAIAARLNHASVLKVFPPHRSGDVVVLPMELATGGDLRRLRGAGYLDIIPVLLDIAEALEHAHERGVIHRDLKPGNVLFDARGGVKLADFGAAGTTSTSAEDARMQGLSPFTASPEQLRGEAPTESDDIYGLGALAYELLSGYPPYYPHFDLRRAQEEPVPNLVPTRQIPPLLSSLVMRMLAKDRRERPHSMRELIDDLDAALNDTLTFDFEALDPADAAHARRVKAESSRDASAAARAEEARDPGVRQQDARDSKQDDEDASDEDEYEDESPDLGLIPELLVANALVVTRKGNRSGSKPGAKPTESPGGTPSTPQAAPDAGQTESSALANDGGQAPSLARAGGASSEANAAQAAVNTRQAADVRQAPNSAQTAGATQAASATQTANVNVRRPADASQGVDAGQAARVPLAASATPSEAQPVGAKSTSDADAKTKGARSGAVTAPPRGDIAVTRESGQGVSNDTAYLPQDEAVSARWTVRGPNNEPAFNETMQLPPAASRGLIDHGVHNDTVQLPPEPGAGLRERIAAVRGAKANNDTTLLSPDEMDIAPDEGTASSHASFMRAATERGPRERGNHERSARAQQAVTQGGVAKPPSPARTQTPSASGGRAFGANVSGGAARGANMSGAPAARAASGVGASAIGANVPGGAAQIANTSSTAMPPRQPPAQQLHEPVLATAGGGQHLAAERPLWESLELQNVPRPRVARLEPIRRRHWPIVLLGVLAGIAVAVFYWLPRYAPQGLPIDFTAFSQHVGKTLAPAEETSTSPPDEATAAAASSADNSATAKLQATRENFDRRLALLEARGAGVWGGAEFAMAKMRAAESVGAHDAGNTQMAQDRLADASRLLDEVESKAPQALSAQLAAGQKALAAGQEEVAHHAFELAKQIDPSDHRITDGERRVQNLNGVLPLLADAQNAENTRNYSRAAQDYSQVLTLDPGNDKARAGLARANAAFGDDNYAKAVGSGFAALGAGRLDDARTAFEKARAQRPSGSEAAEGLRRVGAALSAKGYASLRQRAASLEAQERWDDAVQVYNSALQSDPSLAYAQEGKDRSAARAELAASMQALIDRPERLSSQSVRNQARALLETANSQSPSGPVLRSQIARLGMLLPDYDSSAWRGTSARTDLLEKPVHLSLVSDNATAVTIPSIGEFGTFAKRDIELKPGRYTVIGTRDGYRDIRRDITVSPGQESQTISVSCTDPT